MKKISGGSVEIQPGRKKRFDASTGGLVTNVRWGDFPKARFSSASVNFHPELSIFSGSQVRASDLVTANTAALPASSSLPGKLFHTDWFGILDAGQPGGFPPIEFIPEAIWAQAFSVAECSASASVAAEAIRHAECPWKEMHTSQRNRAVPIVA
jgi:hypothetical protein